MEKKRITYIDIGLHKEAPEIGMMISICQSLGIEYRIYGYEPCPDYLHHLRGKFEDDPCVTIRGIAISDYNGIGRLYMTEQFNGEGNSIYATKNNVDPSRYYMVEVAALSDELETIERHDLTILKYNIEGAELNMMKDLIKTGKYKLIDFYCGATPDIGKVAEIRGELVGYQQMLVDNGIKPFLFHDTHDLNHRGEMYLRMRRKIQSYLLQA
jgi:FkbM family methyltransferase